jgi:hypothetical protein
VKGEATLLAADAAAGSNVTLTLESNDGLSADLFIAIGNEGNELCELAQINQAITGNTSVRVATLKFNHNAGEPIRVYRFDKRKFYGATSATGSFSELTSDGSPKPIEVDDPMGTTLEYSGTTYTHFKATYYNSETDTETDEDDAIAQAGDETLRYATLYDIRKHAGLQGNYNYSERNISLKRDQAENEIDSAIAEHYVLPLSYVPSLIQHICILLAAAYIDYEEFKRESESDPDADYSGDGKGWFGEARGLLKSIKNGTHLLLDADKQELTRVDNSGRMSGHPIDECIDPPNTKMSTRF